MKIYKLIQIETPRLIIRPVHLGDEFPLNKAINNSLNLLQKWQAWAKDPSIEATRGFVQQGVFAWASCFVENFPMVVIHKQNQKIIGASGYNDHSDINQGLYEIGYWCDVDYQGKGYVTEYANALTRYAFDALKATKVVISIWIENKKSIAVAERLGFYNEGIKDRDPHDCVSDQPEKNYIYSASSIDNLLPLEVSWVHTANNGTDSKRITWAKETLKITDNKSFSNSRIILKTPWSSVMAIHTEGKIVYLKHTPELIAYEAKIIQLLRDQFHAPVATVIAYNPGLNCFLMKDAGRSLRSILKKRFDTDLLCKAIDQFTSLQIAVADHVDVFLNIGVPDWRLNKLPDLYKEAISQKNLLIADGLSEVEVNELEALLPKIIYLCQKLSAYSIKQTMVQPDFNDNNTLIDDKSQTITIIDLGEIAISHPFFSLLNCLHVIKKHYALTNKDDTYLRIKDACLKNYMKFDSEKNVLNAFEIAYVLWFVYGLLAHDRLIRACGKEKLMSFQHGKLSEMLKEFIAVCAATDRNVQFT
jgi:RimJ/RimL family protein N-acetyltransferase